MPQDNSPEMKYFVAPGVIELTPAAISLAKAFGEHAAGVGSGNWIVTFSWATAQTRIDRNRGTTTELGPGLGIGAHRTKDVPAAAICEKGGLKYALQIPKEVVAAAERKIIDVDPSNDTAVRLL